MTKSYFLVRAVVAEPLRQKFDHWYSTDHLPRALKDFYFKAEKCWCLRYAVYQFADMVRLRAALASDLSSRWWPASIAIGPKASRARAIS